MLFQSRQRLVDDSRGFANHQDRRQPLESYPILNQDPSHCSQMISLRAIGLGILNRFPGNSPAEGVA